MISDHLLYHIATQRAHREVQIRILLYCVSTLLVPSDEPLEFKNYILPDFEVDVELGNTKYCRIRRHKDTPRE